MRRILSISASILLLASCSGSGSSDSTGQNAIMGVDSEMQNATINQTDAAQLQQEQARRDSIMQDSIRREAESAEFNAAIPNPKKFFTEDYVDIENYLKSLGYTGTTTVKKTMDGDELHHHYKYVAGNKSIKVFHKTLMGRMYTEVTIEGDPDALASFYKKAKKLQGHTDWWNCEVSKKGNTVIIDGSMC